MSEAEIQKPEQSTKFQLNNTDIKKITKGAIIAFLGGFLGSIMIATSTGIWDWKLFIPPALSVGINAVLKFLDGENKNN